MENKKKEERVGGGGGRKIRTGEFLKRGHMNTIIITVKMFVLQKQAERRFSR